MIDVKIAEDWKNWLQDEFTKNYFQNLVAFVKQEYQQQTVYPAGKLLFSAFDKCPIAQLKVVILGQDPYHGVGQANGLCFSVNEGVKLPPSLVNIFKEIKQDIGTPIPISGNLERWAEQGVLLLNAVLSVRAGQPASHANKGWEIFTDAVIQKVNDNTEGVVFLLWGNYAKKKGLLIDRNKHLVLEAAHPSPFSANSGFFGCKHFSQTNHYLTSKGKAPIIW